jgi:hypothetical protein
MSAPAVKARDVLVLLSSLVEKSLPSFDHGTGSHGVLEAIRGHSPEHLLAPCGSKPALERPLGHYLALA